MNQIHLQFDRHHKLCASAPLRETLIVAVLGALSFLSAAHAENWDRFRGPNGAGQSESNAIPSEWREANYLWKQSLPGIGHGSPVIWEGRLYLMSADVKTGEQIVLAFDVASGEQLWDRRFPAETYSINATNSLASCTPAADADRIYVLWYTAGIARLAALSHAGDVLWKKEVGPFKEDHGFGKSPVVVDGVVIVANDSNAASEIVGFDAASGIVRWRVPRESGITAFATPCLLDPSAQQRQLVTVSTASGLVAFDPANGHELWHGPSDILPQRCVSSPIVAGGLVIVTCGQGGNGKHLIAARPGVGAEETQEVYRLTQSIPNCPTPVVAGDLLFLWADRGIVSCCDAATGRQYWRERIGGDYHSSPLRIGNRIFCASMQGDMVVLAADREYQLLARNALGEPCHATPAVANNRLYVRTESTLFCIGAAANN